MRLSSLLGVFAHPDDESLAAGGLLAQQAELGARTAVVTATWASGTQRASQLADALQILGVGESRMLGYADANVPESALGCQRWCDAPLDEAVRRLVVHIRDFRPQALVTFDAYGGITGHPDHIHTHRVAMLAAVAAGLDLYPDEGQPWSPEVVYMATHPRSSAPPIARIVGARRAVYTTPDEQVTDRVDVAPWLERKVAAILTHRSEVERGALPGLVAGLPPADRSQLLATEWFVRHPLAQVRGRGPASASSP